MECLKPLRALFIRQQREMIEVLTGLETANRYTIEDENAQPMLFAAEQSSFLARWFLKSSRPMKLHVVDAHGNHHLEARRPFRFFFHELQIHDAQGMLLGTVKRRFTVLRRRFSVTDASGAELFEILGPILHPWTFRVLRDGEEIGAIRKKWSGLLKEAFTDADHFGVEWDEHLTPQHKAILLAAVFLVDIMYFERSNN